MSRLTQPARIQLWLDRLNRQAASTLTVAEFCQREAVSVPSFYQWKRRLSPRIESATMLHRSRQPQQSLGNPAVAQQPRFTELVLSASPATACVSLPCVSLPGGSTGLAKVEFVRVGAAETLDSPNLRGKSNSLNHAPRMVLGNAYGK